MACIGCGYPVSRKPEKADQRVAIPGGGVAHTACLDNHTRRPSATEPNRDGGREADRAALANGAMFLRS